jgi:hypothetical protein
MLGARTYLLTEEIAHFSTPRLLILFFNIQKAIRLEHRLCISVEDSSELKHSSGRGENGYSYDCHNLNLFVSGVFTQPCDLDSHLDTREETLPLFVCWHSFSLRNVGFKYIPYHDTQ